MDEFFSILAMAYKNTNFWIILDSIAFENTPRFRASGLVQDVWVLLLRCESPSEVEGGCLLKSGDSVRDRLRQASKWARNKLGFKTSECPIERDSSCASTSNRCSTLYQLVFTLPIAYFLSSACCVSPWTHKGIPARAVVEAVVDRKGLQSKWSNWLHCILTWFPMSFHPSSKTRFLE